MAEPNLEVEAGNPDMGTDIMTAPELTDEELFRKAQRGYSKDSDEATKLLADDAVEEEIETTWVDKGASLFEARQELDDTFVDNTSEIVGTALEGAYEQVVRSVGDVGESFNKNIVDVGTVVWGDEQFMGEIGLPIPFTDVRVGYVNTSTYDQLQLLYEIASGEKSATLSNFDIADRDRPDSAAGEMTAAMVRWFAVFAATKKAMGAPAGGLKGAAATGAITDFIAFDPHEARLSNLIKDWGKGNPAFDNAVTDYLSADVTGSSDALEERLKNAIEGLGIGVTTEAVFRGLKWLKLRNWKRTFETQPKTKTTKLDAVDDVVDETPITKESVEADKKRLEAEAKAKADDVAQPEKKTEKSRSVSDEEVTDALDNRKTAERATSEEVARAAVEPEVHYIHRAVKDHLKLKEGLGDDAIEQLAKHIQDGDMTEATKMINFNESRIDWDNLDDGDAVQQLFYAFEDAAKDMLGEAAGGKQTFAMTKKIAEDVGFSAENAESLFGNLRESGGVTARMFAAHQSMIASAQHLRKLATIAADTGANADLFRFHRHIELHAALMAQVKGSQSEIARAMSSMRMMKDAAAESWREFDEVKKVMRGHKESTAIIDQVLAGADDLRALNKVVHKTAGRKTWDVISEIAINGLLSSVKTHVINLTSNAGMTILGPMERYIAAGVGKFSKAADKVTFAEANQALLYQLKTTHQAAKLAFRAAKEGRPISDMRQRIEFDTRKAIKAGHGDTLFAPLGADKGRKLDPMWARGINTIGEVIRIPGRGLLAGDEFFKTIGYNSELAGLSYRRAIKEAQFRKFKNGKVKAQWIKNQMNQHMADPPLDLQADALRFARRQTFQENAETGFGPKVEQLLNFHPGIKLVVAPFVRTPMNLLRQSFVDRNPVLSLFIEKNRLALKAGGPEAQAIAARMISGTAIMGTAYMLVDSGAIQGKGEHFSNTEKLDKIPEHSFKIGDRHYNYSRLDPLGSMIGLVADTHETYMSSYDPTDPDSGTALMELSQAVGLAYMTNALNKTWMKSMSDIIEVAERAISGGKEAASRQAAKLFGDNMAKGIPYSSALRGYTQSTDPVVREAWDMLDRLKRITPKIGGYGGSTDLPPVRDLLGREVTRQNAEWFWINPFGANPETDNPVDKELARLAFDATILDKKIKGVDITSAQFSELKRLIGVLDGRGDTFEESLHKLMQGKSYQEANDVIRTEIVKNLLSVRANAAKELMIRDDKELREKWIDSQIRRGEDRSGERLELIRQKLGLNE